MKPDQLPLIELLYAALHAERGIKVQVISPSVEALRQKLYAVRRESSDQELAQLSFWVSPINPAVLWIGKSNAPNSRK